MKPLDDYFASLFSHFEKGELPIIWPIIIASILAVISTFGIVLNASVVYVTIVARSGIKNTHQ